LLAHHIVVLTCSASNIADVVDCVDRFSFNASTNAHISVFVGATGGIFRTVHTTQLRRVIILSRSTCFVAESIQLIKSVPRRTAADSHDSIFIGAAVRSTWTRLTSLLGRVIVLN
jgi:hypothetical protein